MMTSIIVESSELGADEDSVVDEWEIGVVDYGLRAGLAEIEQQEPKGMCVGLLGGRCRCNEGCSPREAVG